MRALVAAPACVLGVLFGAAVRLAGVGAAGSGPAAEVHAAERALAACGMVGLASLDLAGRRGDAPDGLEAHARHASEWKSLGVDSSHAIDHLLLASLDGGPGASPSPAALVALGRFPRDPRPRLLESDRVAFAREVYLGGERVVELAWRGTGACAGARPLVLHWTPRRLALIDRSIAARVLARLGYPETSPAVALTAVERGGGVSRAGQAILSALLEADAHCASPPAVAGAARPFAQAGPFTVALRELARGPGLEPVLELRGPGLERVHASLQALEAVLAQIHLRGGEAVQRPSGQGAWSGVVSPADAADPEPGVLRARLATGAAVEPGAVVALSGAIRVRVPRETRTLALEPLVPGARVATRLVELELREIAPGRVRLLASRGGERVLGVRAFGPDGAELAVAPISVGSAPAAWSAELAVGGTPSRIEVSVAERLERTDHAFRLDLPPA